MAASGGAFYLADSLEKPWRLPIAAGQGSLRYTVSPISALVYAVDPAGNIRARDLLDAQGGVDRTIKLPGAPGAIAADCADKGLSWMAVEKSLYTLDTHTANAEPSLVCAGKAPIRNLTGHPRLAGCVLWSEAGQVRRLNLGEEAVPKKLLAAAFARLKSDDGNPGPQAGSEAVDVLIRKVTGSKPTFGETAAAALRNSDYSPDEVKRWKKTVRSRNLLPTLTVQFNEREWPAGAYDTLYYTNQYGVRIPNDIHRNDVVQGLNGKEFTMRWDLSNLLFDADEVHVSEEARRRAIDRNDLLKEISRLYYSRAELLVKEYLTADKLQDKDRIALKLELAETAGLLNQICGADLFDPVANPLLEEPALKP